ncbi:MAG: 30S ribosomal protein S1 [Thermodesulfobacteriota bacterium]|nr:30S ribosomal protein S1 [Thermodesulfobacteriota bacterium]
MAVLEEKDVDQKQETQENQDTQENQGTREVKDKELSANEMEIMDLETLYEETLDRRVSIGSVVTGTVVQVETDRIMIDIGRKIEGQAPIKEFVDENGDLDVNVGDDVEVLVESIHPSKNIIRLSKEKAKRVKIWEDIVTAYQEHNYLKATVVERIKGGLNVDIGLPAFLPGSHADIMPLSDESLDAMKGKVFDVAIIKFNRKKNNVVVSRRDVLEKQRQEKKGVLLSTLQKGDVLKGLVRNVMPYGAFVDIGGIDGLLHITDMSWGKLRDPKEKVSSGDEIEVKVIDFNPETEKISLGMKQLLPDPWEELEYRYPIGVRVKGKVTSITNYGAFVELEEGVEGLVHISEMFWTKKVRHPSSILEEGQDVEVLVLGVDQKNRRISLGIKQTLPNPWDLLEDYYPEGTVVDAQVKNVTDFGLFVGVDETIEIDGLIHVSDISWDSTVKNPRDLYKKGDTFPAKVLSIDPDNEKFSLGIKQLGPDPWTQAANEHPEGSVIKGRITSITDFGAFVEIRSGVEGMIHISEVSHDKVESLSEVLEVGEEVEAVVLRVSPENKKIGLSIKALDSGGSVAASGHTGGTGGAAAGMQKQSDKVGTNLGDLLRDLRSNQE